jgi:hypothetical protein
MHATVMLSSGDEDRWENVDVEMSLDLGGSLVIREEETDPELDGRMIALYAPGMWMKAEFEHDEEQAGA